MRSIWKGYIRFSLVTIPIRVYKAVDETEKVKFTQLHKEDHSPIGYEKKCKKCGKTLTGDEIVKGYEFERDQYVIVSDDDIAKIKLESTRTIEIQGFIDASEIKPALFELPYLAGPDGPVGTRSYSLLSEAMSATNKVGMGKVVLRDREEPVMIAPQDGGIMLYRLRQPADIRSMADVPDAQPRQANKDELKLSINLLESMSATLSEIDLSDHYRDALRELIEAKISGKQVVGSPEVQAPVIDLMAALKQSLESAKTKRKPMVQAKGKKAEAPTAAELKSEKLKNKKSKVA